MNKIKIFENPEFGSIRTVDRSGEPWFVGKDVADSGICTASIKTKGSQLLAQSRLSGLTENRT